MREIHAADGAVELALYVAQASLPRMWLIGNLQQTDLVTDLLYASGVRELED